MATKKPIYDPDLVKQSLQAVQAIELKDVSVPEEEVESEAIMGGGGSMSPAIPCGSYSKNSSMEIDEDLGAIMDGTFMAYPSGDRPIEKSDLIAPFNGCPKNTIIIIPLSKEQGRECKSERRSCRSYDGKKAAGINPFNSKSRLCDNCNKKYEKGMEACKAIQRVFCGILTVDTEGNPKLIFASIKFKGTKYISGMDLEKTMRKSLNKNRKAGRKNFTYAYCSLFGTEKKNKTFPDGTKAAWHQYKNMGDFKTPEGLYDTLQELQGLAMEYVKARNKAAEERLQEGQSVDSNEYGDTSFDPTDFTED